MRLETVSEKDKHIRNVSPVQTHKTVDGDNQLNAY